MKVRITNRDVDNLNKFMLLYSKKARKQRLISTYAIPFEFLLVGYFGCGVAYFLSEILPPHAKKASGCC